jgi:hypothetical protein
MLLSRELFQGIDFTNASANATLPPDVLTSLPEPVQAMLARLAEVFADLPPAENPMIVFNTIALKIVEARKSLYSVAAAAAEGENKAAAAAEGENKALGVSASVNATNSNTTASTASSKSVGGGSTRLLVYVNAGDGVLAPVTPGFVKATKSFFNQPCWRALPNKFIYYANDYEEAILGSNRNALAMTPNKVQLFRDALSLLWTYRMTMFFANMAVGDRLVFLILTHGAINKDGVEFLLGGMDERSLTAIARKLDPGVSLFLYTSGCEQSSPIDCPHHFTVDASGKLMAYDDNKDVRFGADIVTLTDTWRFYLSQFEPPTFPVNSSSENGFFNPILLNFLATELAKLKRKNNTAATLTSLTYDELFSAYAQSGWHLLRSDDVPKGVSDEVERKISDGTWNMFRPVIGASSLELLSRPCKWLLTNGCVQ